MWKPCWWLALSLVLLTAVGTTRGSVIRDTAGLFDPNTVSQAESTLNQIERESGVPTVIETLDSLQGESIDQTAQEHARRSGGHGLFIFIVKKEKKIEVLEAPSLRDAIPRARRAAIREAFIKQFHDQNYDAGLTDGVRTIGSQVAEAKADIQAARRRQAAPPGVGMPVRRPLPPRGGGGFGVGSLLGIGLVILVVLFVVRLISGAFGRGGGYAGGPRPGMPGYGAPGYGGGGGGFMSSLFGGLGGALAGNWLYDQFSGRHHQGGGYGNDTSYGADTGPVGGNDDSTGNWSGGGEAGSWGDSGGGGGGDWGGGGGGDWGGGGGGGGSDW